MIRSEKTGKVFEDCKVNLKVKLSALWLTLMLIYIYVDIFMFYKPGVIEDILAGKVWVFEISQAWAVGSLILMMIPAFMILLSLLLKAAVNRWMNIIVGLIYIAVGIGTTVGETWVSYIIGHIVGLVILGFIVGFAWKWPKQSE